MTSAVLTLSALLAASTLMAPVAAAAPQTDPKADRPAAVPSGWKIVKGPELDKFAARFGSRADDRRAPSAGGDASARDIEPAPWATAFQSVRNYKYVAPEFGYDAPNTAVLRARSSGIKGWERFAIDVDRNTESVAFRSLANNHYVSVEKNFTGASQNVLRARSTVVNSWERFDLYYDHEGEEHHYAIRSRLNGNFVSLETTSTGPLQYTLRASKAQLSGPSESFLLVPMEF
ncbi:fascin domain-containing protein [Streptomyces sp. cmx-18-6]|uniref:fascin domain-containing protein n=1 Tax=Streptomyces sp. cmx-18-6 TaxID=2790930 RepID=UPI00397F71F6